jgi:hypothetical protein
MATVYRTAKNINFADKNLSGVSDWDWDAGRDLDRDSAKEILMDTLESYDGFLKCVVTPDKSWTIYLDEDDEQPVIAVKW